MDYVTEFALEPEGLYRAAIEKFGEDVQLNCLYEEAAELIVALNHYRRDRVAAPAVLEEIADLNVMIAQALIILGEKHDCSFVEILSDLQRHEEQSLKKLRRKLKLKPGVKP